MTYPAGTLLRSRKRWLTPNKVLLWSVTGGTYREFRVTLSNVVMYLGEWESRRNIIGTSGMRHHFLTPEGVFGRDSHILDWEGFAPVHE